MITVINNVKKLREDKKAFIDTNAIMNEQIDSIIKDITKKIKRINSTHNVKVIISGDTKSFSFKIDCDDESTIKLIKDVLDKSK
jgi:hypothetical protein